MRAPDWGRLGLRANPFENVLPGERREWVDVPAVVRDALRQRPIRLELQGPKGAGKSTLLRALEAELPDPHRRYLGPGDRLTPLPATGVQTFLLDEADRADRKMLRRVVEDAVARGMNILLATHEPLARALPGSWAHVDLDRVVALGWVGHRVEAVRSGEVRFDFDAAAVRLHALLDGVNYAVQRALYELAEDLARGMEEARSFARAVEAGRAERGGGR